MIRPSLQSAHDADLRLYHVTDSELSGGIDAVPAVVLAAVQGGAGMIQLRDAHASDADLAELVHDCRRALATQLGPRAAQFPLAIGDRLAVAERTGCHLHLEQGGLSLACAREVLGQELMIGVSTRTSEQVREALVAGDADILGIGPVHAAADAAPLGLEGLLACLEPWKHARRAGTEFGGAGIVLPRIVAIGGIDVQRAPEIAAAGVDGIAILSRIASAANPQLAAATLLAAYDRGTVRG